MFQCFLLAGLAVIEKFLPKKIRVQGNENIKLLTVC